jgi:hypothetical protein
MNPKSYVITWTPRSNEYNLKHRLDLNISIAKDIRIQMHGYLDYKLIWPLDICLFYFEKLLLRNILQFFFFIITFIFAYYNTKLSIRFSGPITKYIFIFKMSSLNFTRFYSPFFGLVFICRWSLNVLNITRYICFLKDRFKNRYTNPFCRN